MTTLLIAEHDNKTLKDATAKALTAAKQLGGDVHVLVAGKGCPRRILPVSLAQPSGLQITAPTF